MASRIWETPAFQELKTEAESIKRDGKYHLKHLLKDSERCKQFTAEHNGILLDYSRQQATVETRNKLLKLAEAADLKGKISKMAKGDHINVTEDRAVMHMALRAPREETFEVDGENVVPKVWSILDHIKSFSNEIRAGKRVGATGKPIKNFVSIGIGGSYLGPEFVYEALRNEPTASKAADGRTLRFLANVDPVDAQRATADLDAEETMVIIISKTFTTAETMMNARTLRKWLHQQLSSKASVDDIVAKHMIAVSANVPKAQDFGILPDNVFGFWDWVGGRYSVCSSVGVVPLSLVYGFDVMEKFLQGAADMDRHFMSAPVEQNLPAILGLFGVWNSTFLGYPSRALLPYSQALVRFAAHIQQVDMESNGKRVTLDGEVIPFEVGEVDFGEPGTNGQHSFYQLIHQGRVIPADFIGFIESQQPVDLGQEEATSNHDELMSNFFAQPDALAIGKGNHVLETEGVPDWLKPFKLFPGNRPSNSLLFPKLDAFYCGQLLALYEHRTAVQGFLWNIPSFDQWGVELGKVLAKGVRSTLQKAKREGKGASAATEGGYNPSTTSLLQRYIAQSEA